MKHRAPVLNAAILVLVFAAAAAAQSGGGDQSAPSTESDQLRLAAEQGDADAQFNLGVMYADGEGVPQDYQEAVKWYRLAAEQGYADAQANLGARYDTGRGVSQDYQEAVKWYRLAAEQGYTFAQFNLGSCTPTERAFPRITSRPTSGSTWPLPERLQGKRRTTDQGEINWQRR